jgi:peroxiredoxin Q/BCP
LVTEGNPAPDFELPSGDGDSVRLSESRGRPVVLYFYPKDDTNGTVPQ